MSISENKKIKNATTINIDGINFKSKVEGSMYKTLKEHFENVQYEPETFCVLPRFTVKNIVLKKDKQQKTFRPITYTPDFIIPFKECTIFIEIKGFMNDTYPIKKKLFLQYLEETDQKYMFFEVYTKKELLTIINLIYDYKSKNKWTAS